MDYPQGNASVLKLSPPRHVSNAWGRRGVTTATISYRKLVGWRWAHPPGHTALTTVTESQVWLCMSLGEHCSLQFTPDISGNVTHLVLVKQKKIKTSTFHSCFSNGYIATHYFLKQKRYTKTITRVWRWPVSSWSHIKSFHPTALILSQTHSYKGTADSMDPVKTVFREQARKPSGGCSNENSKPCLSSPAL